MHTSLWNSRGKKCGFGTDGGCWRGGFGSVVVHLRQRGTSERAFAIGGDVTQQGDIWSQPLTRRAAEPRLRFNSDVCCGSAHVHGRARSLLRHLPSLGFLDRGGGAIVRFFCNPAFVRLLRRAADLYLRHRSIYANATAFAAPNAGARLHQVSAWGRVGFRNLTFDLPTPF